LARLIIDLVSDKKGEDILLLDTRAVSVITDYFVIATSDNERQTKAIADEISRQLKKHAVLPLGVEGKPDSGWILMDYNGVLVHLFSRAMRDYYRLEELWEHAPIVVRIK